MSRPRKTEINAPRITIVFSKDIYKNIRKIAKIERISLNDMIRLALDRWTAWYLKTKGKQKKIGLKTYFDLMNARLNNLKKL